MAASTADDPRRRAVLSFRQHGVGVELQALEGVFAAAAVDAGTRHLLRWLAADRYAGARTVLDVGTGYGPLALWLAAADPTRRALAVDRDARALDATAMGASANGLADRVAVAGSLGYDDIGMHRADLIVANVPAKVGPPALAHLLLDAVHHLTEDGTVAVVVVDRLSALVAEVLADPAVEVLASHPSRTYTALEFAFRSVPAAASAAKGFDRGLYRRQRRSFVVGERRWEADVSYSIPEFDSLGHGTVAAARLLDGLPDPVVLAGVGQGHLALALRAGRPGAEVRLVDRDLLALRTTAANLGAGTATIDHAGRLAPAHLLGAGSAVVELPEREPVAVTAALLGDVLPALGDGPLVLHGRGGDLSRVLDLLPRHGVRPEVAERVKVQGHAAARLRLRPRARPRARRTATRPA